MKKSDSQKDFLKKLREVDDLEASLEPKEVTLSVADRNLNPEKLTSEIEQYLNEEPDEESDVTNSNLSSKVSNLTVKKASEPEPPKKISENNGLREKPVSLIAEETEDSYFDSDFDSDLPLGL